jgi:capsule polysaccharide export protein KpsE/RkpR
MNANGRTLSPEAIQSIEARREWNTLAAMLAGAPAPPQIVGLRAEQSSAQASFTTETQEITTNTEVRGVSHLRVCYQLMK